MRRIPRYGKFKRCSGCKVYRPLNTYRESRASLDGRANQCAICNDESDTSRISNWPHESILNEYLMWADVMP